MQSTLLNTQMFTAAKPSTQTGNVRVTPSILSVPTSALPAVPVVGDESQEEAKPNYLLWGGVVVAGLVGIGLIWHFSRSD